MPDFIQRDQKPSLQSLNGEDLGGLELQLEALGGQVFLRLGADAVQGRPEDQFHAEEQQKMVGLRPGQRIQDVLIEAFFRDKRQPCVDGLEILRGGGADIISVANELCRIRGSRYIGGPQDFHSASLEDVRIQKEHGRKVACLVTQH